MKVKRETVRAHINIRERTKDGKREIQLKREREKMEACVCEKQGEEKSICET